MTWTCHVCRRERNDEDIHVASAEGMIAGRAPVKVNIRYCADRAECKASAQRMADSQLMQWTGRKQ